MRMGSKALRMVSDGAGMTKGAPIRIGFLHTHPVQYVAPLYQHLARQWEGRITALYLSNYSVRGGADRGFGRGVQWDIDLVEGYDAQFVSGAERRGEPCRFLSAVAPPLWRQIRSGGFAALIVHGHTPAAMVLAAAAAKASHIPVLMRCETHLGLRRSRLKRLVRRWLIGSFYRRFDAVLAIGSANREFYHAMGVPEDRIFLMPYAVDNRRFMAASCLSAAERGEMRASLGVGDNRPIVLYAGKFQPRKRPDHLLRAAALLNRAERPFQLAMIGSGEMEPQLRVMARDLGLTNICFAGFVNQSTLPRYYGACDIFVLPSVDEPWGLAINEAMCAGLPIIASSEIGCVPDLVRDGRNGRVFSAGDITALAEALSSLTLDAALRARMGEANREIISRWSYAECEAGLAAALAAVGVVVPKVAMPQIAAPWADDTPRAVVAQ
jgi:glycosyltransferase involved in cell wall biosynthesis